MKSLLIISAVFPPEPVVSAKVSQDLAQGLSERQFKVIVISPQPSRPKGFNFGELVKNESDLNDNIKIVRLPSFISPQSNPITRMWESMSFGWNSYKFIKRSKVDKIYMNTWPLFGQFGVAKACVEMNIPYIVHIQDIYPESLTNKLPNSLKRIVKGLLMPFEKYTLKHASKIIVISQNMKSHILQNRQVAQDKIVLVYNWQTEEKFNHRDDSWLAGQPKFRFTYLGNIGPVAGVEFLIKAFQRANLINSCLTIAGSGARKQACIDLANKTPNLDIQFLDVPTGSVSKIQSEANVLLLPVIKGGALSSIPSKLPAYMLSAKPILAIVDKESDTALAIKEANCGWVGDAEDIEWLAMNMKKVIGFDQEKLNILGENGRNYCINNFSKETNLKKLTDSIIND